MDFQDDDLDHIGDLPNFELAHGATTAFHEATNPNETLRSETVAPAVERYLACFYRAVKNRNPPAELLHLYGSAFNSLTQEFFKNTPWPPMEAVEPIVNKHEVFMTLYGELYHRHLYAKLSKSLTFAQRKESFEAYTKLFTMFLDTDFAFAYELPDQWLWDMIDEYVYQFQSFHQYRAKLRNKSEDEIATLRANPDVWSVRTVLDTLSRIVAKSKVVDVLQRASGDVDTSVGTSKMLQMLGYFALLGQLRLHCLTGDYFLALKAVECVDLSKRGTAFTRLTPSQLSTYYYVGFAYFMSRRYVDAIRAFSHILVFISRTQQYHTRGYYYDQLCKRQDQMYSLLAMCVVLCPVRIDDNVHSSLRETRSDKLYRMQRGDEAAFEELFQFACPKFVNPAEPPYAQPSQNHNQSLLRLQTSLFLREVRQQLVLPTIRSYLKLYASIKLEKVAWFLDSDEAHFRDNLMCYKHKMANLVHAGEGGAPLSGKRVASGDVSFFLDGDMAHVQERATTRKHSNWFIRQILRHA